MSRRAYEDYVKDRPHWKTAMCPLGDLEEWMNHWTYTFSKTNTPFGLLDDMIDGFVVKKEVSLKRHNSYCSTYMLAENGKNFIRFKLL